MSRPLARFTLRGVSEVRYGAGRYRRGDEITTAIGSATDRELSKDRRWVRSLTKGSVAKSGHEHARLEARRLYAKLFGAVTDLTAEVEGQADDVRAAFAAYLVERREELGESLQELFVAAGVEDLDEDGDVDLDDLDEAFEDEDPEPRGGEDDEPEAPVEPPAPEPPAEPEPDPEAPTGDPADDDVKAAALVDLEEALASGKGTKDELVEFAIRAGLPEVERQWAESPSAGGKPADVLREDLAELLQAAKA